MGGDTDYCKWGAVGWVSLCLELHSPGYHGLFLSSS